MYRKFLRPGWIFGHLMVVLAVLACLRLGWWQWDRTHEADGTVQNLGYAILWPVFGAAFVYMWFRFLQLELLKDAEDDAELTELAAGGHRDPADRAGLADPGDQAEQQREPGADRAAPADPGFEVRQGPQADFTAAAVGSQAPPAATDDVRPVAPDTDRPNTARPDTARPDLARPDLARPDTARSVDRSSRGITVAVSTVGDQQQDQDPELAAYNRALAALAEKDHRRAR